MSACHLNNIFIFYAFVCLFYCLCYLLNTNALNDLYVNVNVSIKVLCLAFESYSQYFRLARDFQFEISHVKSSGDDHLSAVMECLHEKHQQPVYRIFIFILVHNEFKPQKSLMKRLLYIDKNKDHKFLLI